MSAVAALHLRLGGDPAKAAEGQALREHLRKLGHPACPPVAWDEVERLCLVLFEQHGLDLQTVAAFTLARGHREGLAGLVEGLALVVGLLQHKWPTLWPLAPGDRWQVLAWLCQHLQPLLRAQELEGHALHPLQLHLSRLDELLGQRLITAPPALRALREQVAVVLERAACREAPQVSAAAQRPLVFIVKKPAWGAGLLGCLAGLLLGLLLGGLQ